MARTLSSRATRPRARRAPSGSISLACSAGGFLGGVRPYSSAGGKSTSVRVQLVKKPDVTETRLCGSHEKATVIRRASSEEGKR
jgi:hypothetical protein